jgi:hypothetical protein
MRPNPPPVSDGASNLRQTLAETDPRQIAQLLRAVAVFLEARVVVPIRSDEGVGRLKGAKPVGDARSRQVGRMTG